MNTNANPLTRREALLGTLKGTVATLLALPLVTHAASPASTAEQEPEFVPENDYPFFDYEPGVTDGDHLT